MMMRNRLSLLGTLLVLSAPSVTAQQRTDGAIFTLEEVMIPMRDGAHLQTVIMRPVGRTEPLPILLRRSPYGVPQTSPTAMPGPSP